MCQRLQCSRAIVWSKEPLHEQAEPMADRHGHCWRRTRGRLAMILRRSIILAIASMPLLARAAYSQTAVKVRYVGLLSSGAPFTDTSEIVTGLTAGFAKRGYVVGRSLLFERRAAEAHPDRLPQLVDDLKTKTELIITNSNAAARVVKDRSNVPVVAITASDPVATGLIDSLARPGGTITGIGE